VFYSPYVHPYFLWRFFGFVWLVSFSNRTHVWVPISLSPLVAFAPASESEMGTKERSGCLGEKKRLIGKKEKTVGWKEQPLSR
jgi:hypothetical protein